jgi:ankyrin repeat protein
VDQAMNGGHTPLSIAAQEGHEKCAAQRRAAGAKDVR